MLTRRELHDRADRLQPVRYELSFDFTRSPAGAFVTTRVEFNWKGPGSSTFADLDATDFITGELNGGAIPREAYMSGRLRLDGIEPTNVLTVETRVDFSDDGRGICRYVDPLDGSRYVYTKGMPFAAPKILCCFQGAQLAPFDITVVVPPGWTCLSHNDPREVTPAASGRSWRFGTTPPMPPEQLVVAAGAFAHVSSTGEPRDPSGVVPIAYGCQSAAGELARSAAATIAADCVDVESKLLNVGYPFDRLNLLFVPDYAALGGSSPGITVIKHTLLLESLDPDHRRHVLWALAHEVAHAWFGCMVLDRRWEASWLTEGLATYMCYCAMEALAPELHAWAGFHLLEEAEAHEVDTEEGVHAVAEEPDREAPLKSPPGETYSQRGPIVYAKPAALIRQLATLIGDEAVLEGLAAYLKQHAFGEATTEDLIACWSDAAGQDLTGWATEWLKTPGVNVLEMHMVSDDNVVREAKVVQHAPRSGHALRTHNVRLAAYDLVDGALVPRTPLGLVVAGALTDVPQMVGGRMPAAVLLNAPATTYAKLRLDDRTRQTIGGHMDQFDAPTRATCWVAGFEMVADGFMRKAEFARWVDRYGGLESDPAVREVLSSKAQ